jgi:nuclear transport factor 2 (NTF2) superfamily protein
MSRPPLPPFTIQTAAQKARMAEDAWNSRDPVRVSLAYTEDSVWRNRNEFFRGREAIVQFLSRKWAKEHEYRLVKDLWAFHDDRIAVRFQYEWHDDAGAVASLLRQRAMGVRCRRPDAAARGQHQ